MRTAGRSCDACGERLEVLGDGDGCAPCDVVLCNGCLRETARCPSCQRPFDETRASAPPGRRAAAALGARQLRAVAVTLLGSIVLVNLLGAAPVCAIVLQLAVVGGLLLWTSRGGVVSRWLLVVLVGIASIANAVQAFSAPDLFWIVSASLALLYGWCAFVLALSPSIGAYARAQRTP